MLLGDDEAWATTVMRRLATNGHTVQWQRIHSVAVRWRRAAHLDLLMLDLLDVHERGLRLLKHLRREGDSTPLLGFTATGCAGHRTRALDLGADDCLEWPCDFDELEARCRVLLRRRDGMAAEVFLHGRFRFDAAAHRASVGGSELALPRREHALLRILVGRFGRVVRKDDIGRLLFSAGEVVGSNAVELYMARLRRRLADADVRIRTVRGVGYCLEPLPETRESAG